MIRFIRFLIIAAILVVLVAYVAAFASSGRVIARIQPTVTGQLVGRYKAAPKDESEEPLVVQEYKYDAAVHFLSPSIEVTDFYLRSGLMMVDGSRFYSAHMAVDRVVIELIPLLRYNQVKYVSIEGRKFLGLLTCEEIGRRLAAANPGVAVESVSDDEGKCRIIARFGLPTVTDTTYLEGSWVIDDKGVITLSNRTYSNRWGLIPGGLAQILDEQHTFEIRINIMGDQLDAQRISWTRAGLWLVVSDEPLVVELDE